MKLYNELSAGRNDMFRVMIKMECNLINVCTLDKYPLSFHIISKVTITMFCLYIEMIVRDGVSFDHVNGHTEYPGVNALDGDMYTLSRVRSGAGSEWKMNFRSTWPISKLSITYASKFTH